MTTHATEAEIRRWRVLHGLPPERDKSDPFGVREGSLLTTADQILARPDAFRRNPITGRDDFNIGVITDAEAGNQPLIEEVQRRVQERQAPGRVVAPETAFRNVAFRTPFKQEEIERNVPGFLQPVARAGNELLSPAVLAATALTAGVGPTIARLGAGVHATEAAAGAGLKAGGLAALRGFGAGTARVGSQVLAPITRGGFG